MIMVNRVSRSAASAIADVIVTRTVSAIAEPLVSF